MNKYVLFGGTFDPVHNGHMRIALAAYFKFNADIVFIPAKVPRWKEPTETPENRLAMLRLAIKEAGAAGMSILESELRSADEVNYSIDTVKAFREKHPKAVLYFLIGADQVNRFDEWRSAEELAALAHIVYAVRPGIKTNERIIKKYKMEPLGTAIGGEVSSSAVRELKSLDIPSSVLAYIEKNRLYFIGKLLNYLEEDRLMHSIATAELARLIALKNRLSFADKAYVAGLLHDLGKSFRVSKEMELDFMRKNFPEYVDLPPFARHQFVGAHLAEQDFGIKDLEILDAIRYHCTGKAGMSPLGKIVYASDKIEPTRDFDSRFLINPCLRNYEKGFLLTLADNKKYLLQHAKDIENVLTDACFRMYLREKERQ